MFSNAHPQAGHDLYERVTEATSGAVEHQCYVRSPEQVVAIALRRGADDGTRYMHVDHLGSVDVLTDEDCAAIERWSYDPFGQRRSPVWGEPAPASFASRTTLGFTGHEGDDELGLVNMKGRIYDPRVGRFLTTDPIVSLPFFGQSWNPYTYVVNNPLNFVDASGFQAETEEPDLSRPIGIVGADGVVDPCLSGGCLEVIVRGTPREPRETSHEAVEVGVAAPPVDVSATGSASGYVPQTVTTAPIDWSQNPYVQLEGGFLGGLLLGLVPFAGVGHELLDRAGVLPHGTPQARTGLAIGQIVGGVALTIGGLTGEVLGGITSATGIGAAIGGPAIAVSTALVVGGVGNIAAGIQGLSQALMSSGSGSTGPKGPASGTGGPVLAPYGGPGGGHHVPAKAAFKGDSAYDLN